MSEERIGRPKYRNKIGRVQIDLGQLQLDPDLYKS